MTVLYSNDNVLKEITVCLLYIKSIMVSGVLNLSQPTIKQVNTGWDRLSVLPFCARASKIQTKNHKIYQSNLSHLFLFQVYLGESGLSPFSKILRQTIVPSVPAPLLLQRVEIQNNLEKRSSARWFPTLQITISSKKLPVQATPFFQKALL